MCFFSENDTFSDFLIDFLSVLNELHGFSIGVLIFSGQKHRLNILHVLGENVFFISRTVGRADALVLLEGSPSHNLVGLSLLVSFQETEPGTTSC